MIEEQKQKSFQKLENSRTMVIQEFDGIGKELMQNIADMRNIESDINQNIDKIITKIDIQDFLQILEKYALKLANFNIIKDLLKKEKASVGKFAFFDNERGMQEMENKFVEMFNMG